MGVSAPAGLHIAGVTAHPSREWAVHSARNVAADLGMRIKSLRLLMCDRYNNYGSVFDAVCEAEELEVILNGPRLLG